jgi:glycosyltransferase involved in cell wall biosynthesis
MRVSYWTGWLDPHLVAVSKEVHQLMRRFPGSYAIGISTHYSLKMSLRDRSFGVHPNLYQFVRPFFGLVERRFDVSHVYTSLGDWHFLNVLGRRPIVLTLTQPGTPAEQRLLDKVEHVVAETERLAESASRHGVPPAKVSVIYPGVDLDLFTATPPPPTPWKCLFASSPENEDEIHSKGVDLLLEAATRMSDVEFTILWRPFGAAADVALQRLEPMAPRNVTLIKGRIPDMHRFMAKFHFVLAPFRTVGKPCPNSILESLALARPVLVSDFVDIGPLIESAGAGLAFSQGVHDLCGAIEHLCDDYAFFQRNARRCAERHFDLQRTVDSYRKVYERVVRH